MAAAITVSRDDVLRFRFTRHQLDRAPASADGPTDVDLLDFGVQDTGTDGAAWALAIRGATPADADGRDLAYAWTLRGAPHAYRRTDIGKVAIATSPLSEADAAKRIFDASKPLRAAGVPILDALTQVADELRELTAAGPIVKGDASRALTGRLPEHFLRFCRACDATHIYEQPFRLAALQAGLELEAGTSPPVLTRIPRMKPLRFRRSGAEADAAFDPIRNYLRFYGPATMRDAAAFIDAAAKDVKANWPADAVEVQIADGPGDVRWLLEADVDALAASASTAVVRLLGSHDGYLQLRDRELLVPDDARRKELWRIIGRPGAIAVDGELVGTWRPKASSGTLTLTVELWRKPTKSERAAIEHEAERLAAHRGVRLKDVAGLA